MPGKVVSTIEMMVVNAGGVITVQPRTVVEALGLLDGTITGLKGKVDTLEGAYVYRGTVPTEQDLPTTNVNNGDTYNIAAESTYGAAGQNVAWNGSSWDSLGSTLNVSPATQQANGLMSSQDKTKLDGIEAGANAYSLPAATENALGGIKVGENLAIAQDGTLSATGASIDLGITGASVGEVAAVAAVDGSGKPTAWGAVSVSRIMTISLTDADGHQATGQTVTVRETGATGEIVAQLPYSGTPVQVTLPLGLHYHVSASDTLPLYGPPSTATGVIGAQDVQVSLQYAALDSVLVKDTDTGRYTNESLADWWTRQRDHKVYGVSIPKGESVQCTKTLDNADVPNPTPGWVGHPAIDPYAGKGPFAYVLVNGGADPDGSPYVTSIKGIDSDFALDGSNGDVWSMTPVRYRKYDETGTDVLLKSSDTPHVGLSPCPGSILPDGTLRPYMLYARYAGVKGSDGKMHSYSGKQTWNRSVSHNSLITQCDTANTGYSGYNTSDMLYLQDMWLLKYATKDAQTAMMGCTNYNYNYSITVAETGVRRAIIATTQADTLVVGSSVTIGTASSGTQVLTETVITSIEPYDDTNSAVNLAATADFDTTVGNKLSTAPWVTGRTDGVEGDGAYSQAGLLSGKEPCVIQGIECFVGVTEVVGNVIASSDGETGWYYYVNNDSKYEVTSVTENYQKCDQPLPSDNADGWKYGLFAHESNGMQYPTGTGGSTTVGMCDGSYLNKTVTAGTRECQSGGYLSSGRSAGPWYAYCVNVLSVASWSIGSRLSANGRNGGELLEEQDEA